MDIEPNVVDIANEIAKNIVRTKAKDYKELTTEELTKKLVEEYYKAYNMAIANIHEITNLQRTMNNTQNNGKTFK